MNRFLNIGQLGTDAQGHLYYAFGYLPEPTVRQYDHLGYAGQDIQYTAIDALPTAVAVRKEIERQEQRGKEPTFKRVLTGMGVDRANGEVWIALNNNLLHFDAAGNRLKAKVEPIEAEIKRLSSLCAELHEERPHG